MKWLFVRKSISAGRPEERWSIMLSLGLKAEVNFFFIDNATEKILLLFTYLTITNVAK